MSDNQPLDQFTQESMLEGDLFKEQGNISMDDSSADMNLFPDTAAAMSSNSDLESGTDESMADDDTADTQAIDEDTLDDHTLDESVADENAMDNVMDSNGEEPVDEEPVDDNGDALESHSAYAMLDDEHLSIESISQYQAEFVNRLLTKDTLLELDLLHFPCALSLASAQQLETDVNYFSQQLLFNINGFICQAYFGDDAMMHFLSGLDTNVDLSTIPETIMQALMQVAAGDVYQQLNQLGLNTQLDSVVLKLHDRPLVDLNNAEYLQAGNKIVVVMNFSIGELDFPMTLCLPEESFDFFMPFLGQLPDKQQSSVDEVVKHVDMAFDVSLCLKPKRLPAKVLAGLAEQDIVVFDAQANTDSYECELLCENTRLMKANLSQSLMTVTQVNQVLTMQDNININGDSSDDEKPVDTQASSDSEELTEPTDVNHDAADDELHSASNADETTDDFDILSRFSVPDAADDDTDSLSSEAEDLFGASDDLGIEGLGMGQELSVEAEPEPVETMSALDDLPVNVHVLLDSQRMTLQQLAKLHVGSTLSLADDSQKTVSLLANGKVFAQAELISINDQLAARIIDMAK